MEYYVENTEKLADKHFHCHEQYLEARRSIQPHIHDWVEILYCVEGSLRVTLGNSVEAFPKGSLIVIPINEVHRVESVCDSPSRYLVIKFSMDLLFSIVDEGDYDCILPFILRGSAGDCLFGSKDLEAAGVHLLIPKILREYETKNYGYRLALRAYIYQLILFAVRTWHKDEPKPHPQTGNHATHVHRVFDVLFHIQKNYSQPITLEAMAKRCHVSYSYFSRQFSFVTGQSFATYLCSVRLAAAEHLLISTDIPVTDIAFQVGFSDASYFTRRFSAKNGMTPNVYRKRYSTIPEA